MTGLKAKRVKVIMVIHNNREKKKLALDESQLASTKDTDVVTNVLPCNHFLANEKGKGT